MTAASTDRLVMGKRSHRRARSICEGCLARTAARHTAKHSTPQPDPFWVDAGILRRIYIAFVFVFRGWRVHS